MTRWHEMAKNISVNNYAKWIRNRIIKHVTELSSPNPRLFPPPATFLCQIIHLIQSKLTLHTNTVLMIYIYRFFMFVFCLLTLWLHSSNLYVYHWSPHSAYSLNQLRFALRLQLTHAYRDQSIHSPQLFLTCSLYGFSTQTHKHTQTRTHSDIDTHTGNAGFAGGKGANFPPAQRHLPRTGKVNEQEWFVCKRGSEHTMCFAIKLFCQLWRLWEHTAHTNRLPQGPLPLIRHNHQQQMTERGGWRHRARLPLTEGDIRQARGRESTT